MKIKGENKSRFCYEGYDFILMCEHCGHQMGNINVSITDPGTAIALVNLTISCPSCGNVESIQNLEVESTGTIRGLGGGKTL